MLPLLLALACAPHHPQTVAPPSREWVAPLGHAHPLLGVVWSPAAEERVLPEQALTTIASAPTLLLGEKHDNPDHHLLQAELLGVQHASSVVFEMLNIDVDVADVIAAEDIPSATGWEDSGWPDFELYEPVFAQALAQKAHLLPGHPTKAQVQSAMKGGVASLDPEELDGMDLSVGITPAERERLQADIVESHCGHAPQAMVDMMVQAQELKDRSLARALEQAPAPRALIAGHGHTRRDGGVPAYLSSAPLVVHFQEVHDDALTPADYDLAGADLVWFTARVDDLDPCERFREQLEQMGH